MLLKCQHLSKRYGKLPLVVDNVSFEVRTGELLALVGPSGCGKTTTLRLIAGLEQPETGSITLLGRDIGHLPPEKRNIGMVFQDYALFPHLTVLHNTMFGLKHLTAAEKIKRAKEVLDLVGLSIFAERYPHQLSGGQQQRTALARALAPEPQLLLLDEPFSNLDASARHHTREEVQKLLKSTGMTAILVTHDQEEALSIADRIAIMRSGRIEQIGTAQEVYNYPQTVFTASFVGRNNLLSGTARGKTAQCELGEVALLTEAVGIGKLAIRPENIHFADGGVAVRIVSCEYKGHYCTYKCEVVGSDTVIWVNAPDKQYDVGSVQHVQVHAAVTMLHA